MNKRQPTTIHSSFPEQEEEYEQDTGDGDDGDEPAGDPGLAHHLVLGGLRRRRHDDRSGHVDDFVSPAKGIFAFTNKFLQLDVNQNCKRVGKQHNEWSESLLVCPTPLSTIAITDVLAVTLLAWRIAT